jgi:mono/diheme cytochrome c family protein
MLGGLEGAERKRAVGDLVHFLVSLGGPESYAAVPVRPDELELGRQLYHEVGCVACHAPREEAERLQWPFWELKPPASAGTAASAGDAVAADGAARSPALPLGDLTGKTSVEALAAFLLDPLATRPSGRMPSLRLTPGEAHAIALYLLGEQVMWSEGSQAFVAGLEYEYYKGDFGGALPAFDALQPVRTGVVPDFSVLPHHREDRFAFRFRGFVECGTTGQYLFRTRSDDGSRLWIDGRMVVDNDGEHAPQDVSGAVWLEAGRHAITVAMYENAGGEELGVFWTRPMSEPAQIDAGALSHISLVLEPPKDAVFAVDAERAARGRERFGALGCAACHSVEGVEPAASGAHALDALDPDAPGCLAGNAAPGAADYALDARDRESLAAVLRGGAALALPLEGGARLQATLERMDCFACHRRGERGGPDPERRAYFETRGHAELGDEGRMPPELDGCGAKLRERTLRTVLLEGATARPYMATRMPSFGAANVAQLVDLFPAIDAEAGDEDEPAFSLEAVEAGRRLVGTKGLGCIQCHTFAGHASLGVPAVDLAEVHSRLKPRWFHRLLAEPASMNQGTRMPLFWLDGKSPARDVYDGDPARQIEAIWSYLSLERSAPLPEGLVIEEGAYEIVPIDRPRLVGVFMEGLSPRTIAVGFPENVHYAFDVQNSRLGKAWRGSFFDAQGTWVGRAGALERAPDVESIDLPAGLPFTLLAIEEDPWPEPADASDAGYRVLGRSFDAERVPSFRYGFGDVVIEEKPRPLLAPGGAKLVRAFRVLASVAYENLWMRAATGMQIHSEESAWVADERLRLGVRGSPEVRVRRRGTSEELLVRVGDWTHLEDEKRYESRLEVELSW